LLCATKSIKTLRSIQVLLDENIGEDALALCRHLFENYLHIVFSLARPEMMSHLIDAPIGIKIGTHDFFRHSNGRIDSRRIVRKKDGEEFIGHISYYKMAESSSHSEDVELFDYIYSFLSEHTHPTFSGFELLVNEEGKLGALSNEFQAEAAFFSICLVAMILNEIRNIPSISDGAKMDIQTVVRRVAIKAGKVIEAAFDSQKLSAPFAILRNRLITLI